VKEERRSDSFGDFTGKILIKALFGQKQDKPRITAEPSKSRTGADLGKQSERKKTRELHLDSLLHTSKQRAAMRPGNLNS